MRQATQPVSGPSDSEPNDGEDRFGLTATAFHEAGHAVVARRLGADLECASVVREGMTDGYAQYTMAAETYDGVVAAVAGMVAQRMWWKQVYASLGIIPPSQASLDEDAVHDYESVAWVRDRAQEVFPDGGKEVWDRWYGLVVARAKRSATQHVWRHWGEIHALAMRLIDERTVRF